MKKIIIASDSFKGTLSSLEVCNIAREAMLSIRPALDINVIPIADGGEGSVDAFLHAVGGDKITKKTKGPNFDEVESFYGILKDKTAIIEMASSAGFSMAKTKNPLITTTYGVGELIKDAIEKGCKNIIVGLGGSSTNDAGCGAASAMGAKFFNKNNEEFIPTGGTLKNIVKIDLEEIKKNLEGITVTTMCDIDNPMYGKNGAAFVFAGQKGASETDVFVLDENLRHFASLVKKNFRMDLQNIKGGGAAGGMGVGMVVFFDAKLQMGIDTVLEVINFDKMLKDTDLVISGEGNLDKQSLGGKVLLGIAKRTQKENTKLIAIVGGYDEDIDEIYNLGVNSVFSINTKPESFEVAKLKTKANLYKTVQNLSRVLFLK